MVQKILGQEVLTNALVQSIPHLMLRLNLDVANGQTEFCFDLLLIPPEVLQGTSPMLALLQSFQPNQASDHHLGAHKGARQGGFQERQRPWLQLTIREFVHH